MRQTSATPLLGETRSVLVTAAMSIPHSVKKQLERVLERVQALVSFAKHLAFGFHAWSADLTSRSNTSWTDLEGRRQLQYPIHSWKKKHINDFFSLHFLHNIASVTFRRTVATLSASTSEALCSGVASMKLTSARKDFPDLSSHSWTSTHFTPASDRTFTWPCRFGIGRLLEWPRPSHIRKVKSFGRVTEPGGTSKPSVVVACT